MTSIKPKLVLFGGQSKPTLGKKRVESKKLELTAALIPLNLGPTKLAERLDPN